MINQPSLPFISVKAIHISKFEKQVFWLQEGDGLLFKLTTEWCLYVYNIFIYTHIKHVKNIISMLYIYMFVKTFKLKN